MADSPSFQTNNIRTLSELTAWQAQPDEAVLEPERPIIDPHHHLRERPGGRYHLPELAKDLSGGHNMRATVFVDSAEWYPRGTMLLRPVGETEFVNGVAAMSATAGTAHPVRRDRRACDLTPARRSAKGVDALEAGKGRFRGIRDPLAWDASDINYGRTPARRRTG